MDNAEFLSMPNRQVKSLQFQDGENEEAESPVRMFSMENVADRVFHRKKKMVGEFDDEETRRNDYRNKLAILKGDLESGCERKAITGEEMEDWFKNLQIRTQQHPVRTPVVTTKLSATNNVATAAVRLKGNVRIDKGEKIVSPAVEALQSHRRKSQQFHTSAEEKIAEERYENIEDKYNAKEVAVRSKKLSKQSIEQKAQTRRKKSTQHNNVVDASSETRRNSKTRPHDFLATEEGLALSDDPQKSKIKSNKNPHSSIKSTIHEEH